jgi:dTDP-4-dehydrorhamnose 3,5-epimerase
MFDVVLDLRPESLSYGKWYWCGLSAKNGRMLHVHSIVPTDIDPEDDTEMHYMTSEFYTAAAVFMRFDDQPSLHGRYPLQWFLNRIVIGRL